MLRRKPFFWGGGRGFVSTAAVHSSVIVMREKFPRIFSHQESFPDFLGRKLRRFLLMYSKLSILKDIEDVPPPSVSAGRMRPPPPPDVTSATTSRQEADPPLDIKL